MKQDGTPGAVVLVRSRKGNWTAAFGTRTVGTPDPVRTDDVFRVGDVTVSMTATLLLQLREQGKISLDDPISKYVAGVPDGDRITLRDLGTYRSGLFDYEQDASFRAAYAANPRRSWTPQELLRFAYAHPLQPTEVGSYSSTDFVLLGLVVEKVTGQSAAAAFQANLFRPLGSTRIGLAVDATLPDGYADGYSYAAAFADPLLSLPQREAATRGALTPTNHTTDNPSWAFTAGAAYADAADLADVFDGMLSGPLLNAASRAERTREMGPLIPDATDAVQYGFGIARYGQYLFYSGNLPGYSALAASDPAAGTTIVVLTNSTFAPDGGSPVSRIFAAAANAVDPVTQTSDPGGPAAPVTTSGSAPATSH